VLGAQCVQRGRERAPKASNCFCFIRAHSRALQSQDPLLVWNCLQSFSTPRRRVELLGLVLALARRKGVQQDAPLLQAAVEPRLGLQPEGPGFSFFERRRAGSASSYASIDTAIEQSRGCRGPLRIRVSHLSGLSGPGPAAERISLLSSVCTEREWSKRSASNAFK